MIQMLLLLLLVPFCSSSPRLPEEHDCPLENSKLQQRLKILQDLSHLCELQLKDLLGNNYHRKKSKIFSAMRTQQNTVFPTTSGNLLVYDQEAPREKKGGKSTAMGEFHMMHIIICNDQYMGQAFNTTLHLINQEHNCAMVLNSGKTESGYYRIKPREDREPFLVYCDMLDGEGWTVIQRRTSGKENFYRRWADYRQGFGQLQSKDDEYWLGNDKIYDLLLRGETSLKIDLMDWQGETRYAIYDNFQIKNGKDKYRIWFGTFSGTAGDALSGGGSYEQQWSASLSGMQFSTYDRDNDRFLAGNCAEENKSGWWFNRCHAANLNGQYYKDGEYNGSFDNGVVWATWRGLWYSLKYTTMKIRLLSFADTQSGDGEL